MVFPAVMYGCESWTVKKAECQRIDAFELWCWRRLQPVHPKGDQSWVFVGRTDAKAETPILWSLTRRDDSFEKTLMLGKIKGRRRRGWHRMRWLDGITDSMDMSLNELWWTLGVSDGQGVLTCCSPWDRKESDMTQRLNWTDIQLASDQVRI